MSKCYRKIGELSGEQKQYKKALEFFQVGIETINKNCKYAEYHPERARILYQIGVTNITLQKHKEAVEILKECQKVLEKSYAPNHPEMGKVAYEFGFA